MAAKRLLLATIVFTVVLRETIRAMARFYWLLRRYDASLIAPIDADGPAKKNLDRVISGVVLLDEKKKIHVRGQLVAGGLIAIAGVGIVAARRSKSLPPETVIQKPR